KKNATTWSFVTLYYLLFFSATTFLRFFHRGYLYLSTNHINSIENYYAAVHSSPIRLQQGTYYFAASPSPNAGQIIITISHKSDGVHKLTLNMISDIVRQEMIPNADSKE